MMSIKKLGRTAIAGLLLLALAAPLLSVSGLAADASPYEQQWLQARYGLVSARVNFMAGVLTDTVSLVPNASDLAAHADRLSGDLGVLKGYVDANDRGGFNAYVSETIHPDMKAALEALRADIRQFKAWGVSGETMKQLKEDYQARKATFGQQADAAVIELGSARLAHYNNAMSKADDRMAKLSAKGVDVSGMQGARAGAGSGVVGPLQAAVSSGDASAIKNELHDRCLANGAPYSYHFYAKTGLEALKGISAKIGASTNNSTIKEQLAAVDSRLSAAQEALNAAGASPYTAEQKSQVWDNLKAASSGLKEIIKELSKGQGGQG